MLLSFDAPWFCASTSIGTSYRSWTRSISTMAHVLEDNVFFCPFTHKPPQTYAFTTALNPNFGPKTPILSEPPCTYTYCAFSNLQYVNVHRLPLCGNCTCVPQWLSYKVVRRPSPWGTWTFQITFPGERGASSSL